MAKDLERLLGTTLERRQALKLMAGTVATGALAACGVGPGPKPPTTTNLLVLRGKVQDLTGRNRERLRAIADFLALGNLQEIDILGQYWARDKPMVNGLPGSEFLGDGFDMVVIAKGESGAAVRAWARQWSNVVDIDSDEAKIIEPAVSSEAAPDDTSTFLVFERRAGLIAPEQLLTATSPQVYIASHHVLVNDRNRKILVVRAPSRGAVIRWVQQWGTGHPIQILALTDLASQLKRCYLSPSCQPEAVALPAPALAVPRSVQPATYYPKGVALDKDQKFGTYYFRHRVTDRYLSIDDSGKVVTVAVPAPNDRWTFTRGKGFSFGKYYLQHQGTGKYLNSNKQKDVFATDTAQSWTSGLTIDQGYSPMFGDNSIGALAAISNGEVSSDDSGVDPNWEQWDHYPHPSDLEQALNSIISTHNHDAPWPEDSYEGDSLDAYNFILTYLNGRVPKNGNVDDSLLGRAKTAAEGKFGGVLPPAWAAVFEHLDNELSHFTDVEKWYGDGGHVAALLNEMTINNQAIINKVQALAHPPSGTTLNFLLAALITDISIAAAAAIPPPAGPVVGALIAGIWRLYSAATAGSKDTLSTTFANLFDDLTKNFNDLITQREVARSAIASNWGRLSTFSGMINDKTLVWPDDTAAVRAVANRQFEISVWQSVLNKIWTINGWGNDIHDPNRGDDSEWLISPWRYVITVPIKYQKNGTVYGGWTTTVNEIGSSAPYSLAKHLFDDKEGLGISMTDFYVGKNGWAMPWG